jgi:hypothetical protein
VKENIKILPKAFVFALDVHISSSMKARDRIADTDEVSERVSFSIRSFFPRVGFIVELTTKQSSLFLSEIAEWKRKE